MSPFFGGCKQKKSQKKPAPPVFLVAPQERERLQQNLLKGLLSNGRFKCPRPALRGTARAGSADGMLRALMEPSGATARCLAYAERHWANLRRALFEEPSRLPGGPAGRGLPQARPLVKPAAKPGERATRGSGGGDIVGQLRRRCASLSGLVEQAVQRADACSPYLPGRRRMPRLGPVLQLHLAMVALARHQFQRSPREAVWMLLYTLRLGQDLGRGGTAWIWPQVIRLGVLDTVATLRRMLGADRLSEAALAEVKTAIERLRDSEPALSSHLRGERQNTELVRYLIPMMPRKWIPPGGRPLTARPGAARPGPEDPRRRSLSGSIRQDLLVGWVAALRYARRLSRGCQDAASDWHCLKAVRAVEKQVVDRRGELQQRWQALNRRLARSSGKFDRAATKEAVVELLAGLHAPDTSGYLLQAAQRGFYLTALGLHVRVLIASRAQWPGLDTVTRWSKARPDPFRKAPLRLKQQGTGFELRPAEPLKANPKGAVVRYVIPGPTTDPAAASPSPGVRGKSGRDGSGAPPGPRPRTR